MNREYCTNGSGHENCENFSPETDECLYEKKRARARLINDVLECPMMAAQRIEADRQAGIEHVQATKIVYRVIEHGPKTVYLVRGMGCGLMYGIYDDWQKAEAVSLKNKNTAIYCYVLNEEVARG